MSDFVRGAAPGFTSLMARVQQRQSPALLWYSVPGERIELSGRVLDNWVSKTANFLVDECELEDSGWVLLGGAVHWRSVVFALASLRTGAALALGAADAGADVPQVQVAFEASELSGSEAEYPVLVDRGPLSMRFMGEVPAGVTDYCAEVRSHSDVYLGLYLPSGSSPALLAEPTVSFDELMGQVAERAAALSESLGDSCRAAVLPGSALDAAALVDVLAVLAAGYAVLILDPAVPWDDERRQRVLADELAAPYPTFS